MIDITAILTSLPLTMKPVDGHAGLSGLFAAAVVSKSFCNMLLSAPQQALQQGYMGKTFALSPEDASLIISLERAIIARPGEASGPNPRTVEARTRDLPPLSDVAYKTTRRNRGRGDEGIAAPRVPPS